MEATPIGTFDGAPPAYVDTAGSLTTPAGARIDWCVIAEDRLHDPADSSTLRQHSDGAVVETAIRITGGDAVLRAYAVPNGIVLEFENAGAAACAFAVMVDAGGKDRPSVHGPRPAAQSGSAPDRERAIEQLRRGATIAGDQAGGDRVLTLVWPVAHRTSLSVVLAERRIEPIPTADAVRRGWNAQLASGMRVDIDDRVLQDAIDQARVATLVEAPVADRDIVRALEDWGFDHEAALAWNRLGWRARRGLRNRRPARDAWNRLLAAQQLRPSAHLLNAMHDLLIAERDDVVDIVPQFPPAWLGLGVAAHDIPLRAGSLSFALRWHGERPALLWECEGAVTLRCSSLGPQWSSDETSGETLFPTPDVELFGLDATATAPLAPPILNVDSGASFN